MALRAQISLQFDDAELFEQFIEPYKRNRLLNGIIIKCLSAYYYNEEVRNLIEGSTLEDVTDDENIVSTQDMINNIRASLLMQDFLTEELQNSIDNGSEDIENILNRTNSFAKQEGVMKETKSDFGSTMLHLEDKSLQNSSDIPKDDSTESSKMDFIFKAISVLLRGSSDPEAKSLLNDMSLNEETSRGTSETSDLHYDDSNVTENTDPIEVENTEDTYTEEIDSTPEEIEDNTHIEEADDNTSEDASASMQELLGSLF